MGEPIRHGMPAIREAVDTACRDAFVTPRQRDKIVRRLSRDMALIVDVEVQEILYPGEFGGNFLGSGR